MPSLVARPSAPPTRVVSATQLVTLRTLQGVQLDQFPPSEQISLQWGREKRQTSHLDMTVAVGAASTLNISPWLHWLDVWDDTGRVPLWTGPILNSTSNKQQTQFHALDISGLASRTRNPLSKSWDSTDPALIAEEFYDALIEWHGIPARTLSRTDPLGTPFSYTSVADANKIDAVMTDLVNQGLYWTVINGVIVLGPWDRTVMTSLGEDDFIGGGGMSITRDGTNSYNDILLKSGNSKARSSAPMGGLRLQEIVEINNMFGVSNTDNAVRQAAQYRSKIHDMISLPSGSILNPLAPVTIDQLMPSARLALTGFGQTFLMELDSVSVTSQEGESQVAITVSAVDDNLPELIQLEAKRSATGLT